MDGHGSAVGGFIVDGGNFDWAVHADKFPGLLQPDPSYHNLVYANTFGRAGLLLLRQPFSLWGFWFYSVTPERFLS